MKKNFKTMAAAIAVTGTMAMTMGMSMSAFAATSNLNTKSTVTDADDTTTINLIKDYDSFAPTAAAPLSKSPADKFTYTIKPYKVWNAGNVYSSAGSGDATQITAANMPMPTVNTQDDVTDIALDGENAERTLTFKLSVPENAAKYEETADNVNAGDKSVKVTLPEYTTVGDYWYEVKETDSDKKTTGVIYATNSLPGTDETDISKENGGHNRTYYIHVQVTQGTSKLVRTVTMHQSAPATTLTNAGYNAKANTNVYYDSANKVNAIENRYYAGDLVIKKEVTGNAGDKSEYFEVTVTFTKPAGTYVNSDITYSAVFKDGNTYTSKDCVIKGQYYNKDEDIPTIVKWSNSSNEMATATCVFYVKDNSTVTFSNIPYGINYSISEALDTDDTYQNKIAFTSTKDTDYTFDNKTLTQDNDSNSAEFSSDATKTAVGSISDARDEVTITNKKENTIDVGVLLSNAPYAAMLALAGTAGVVFVKRRKKDIED